MKGEAIRSQNYKNKFLDTHISLTGMTGRSDQLGQNQMPLDFLD
jgi:hypothetical protein